MDKNPGFSEFYCEHFNDVYKYVKYILGDNFIAEDITQETFLEAWRKYDIITEHPNVMGWLMRTARYKMRNMNKKMCNNELTSLDESQTDIAREENGFAMKAFELFLEAVLDKEEQTRFRRYYIWGYSSEEICELENITEINARVRISRLYNKLKKELEAVSLVIFAAGGVLAEICVWVDILK